MSRDDFDIPEVFRRAMEEAGWRDGNEEGSDEGDGGDGPPRRSRRDRPPQLNRSLWILGLIFLLLLLLNWAIGVYTDWLWFSELRYESVWTTQWIVRVISFAAGFIIAAAVLLLNWHIARRRAIKATSPFNPQFLAPRGIGWLISAGALFLAFAFGSSAAAQWSDFLVYVNRVPFDISDPIFNLDVGFYIFELPVFEFIQGWLLSLLFVALLGAIPIYLINQLPDLQRGSWRLQDARELRQHVAIAGGLLLSIWSIGYLFDIYALNYSPRGVVFGASYADINGSLWALRLQFLFMALTAIVVFLNFFGLRLRPLLVTGALWLAATFLIGGIYPGLIQRYVVEPNEVERERQYIDHNIDFTRMAFGLENIETRPFEQVSDLSEQKLQADEDVVQNVRLWDYRPLQRTYEQLQALRPYYQFSPIDIDRYVIDGEVRQVMLAARELDREKLPAPSWVNRNLEFTHGYGLVMNPVDRVTPDGQPEFFIQDLPPQSSVPIEVTQPEIYFGEMTNDPVFVSSGREEFSYPSGNENVYTSYQGTGGVALDSFLKRVVYAIRLGDANVLLSDEIDSGTRLQYDRQIQERVQIVAPFLALDRDPYIVVDDAGRLVWIQDAYTVSGDYPYATRTAGGLNYIRNSVKVVVDAYNGTVDFYISDPDDPIIQAYDKIFPGMMKPFSEFPQDLISHIRYPQDLFDIQAEQFLAYHMTDTRVFYNKEDLWDVPLEIFDGNEQELEPYYVYLRLREEEEPEYLLIQPFTPAGKQNMISWMAARNDPEHYGELIVYELPKQELVFGPLQVEGRIDQEPEISQQFSLWDQRGSSVIRGNLLVIPIDDSFVFVEPVYLLSDTNALPELKQVIVATDTRIAMRETLPQALNALLQIDPGDVAAEIVEEVDVGETGAEPPAAGETGEVIVAPDDATLQELINSANQHFEAAEAAQRDGDWALYGRELQALNDDLQRLMEAAGVTP